ncbi:hypothetical protein D3C75_523880 [compost metagenome]
MSDKVKLTKNQISHLEILGNRYSPKEIIEMHLNHSEDITRMSGGVSTIGFNDLAKALYIGYEQKKSPEQEVLDMFQKGLSIQDKALQTRINGAYQLGIQNTLMVLGITIEGINNFDEEGYLRAGGHRDATE